MKKLILLVLTTLMMVGCNSMKKEYNRSYENDYETIYVDGCEYIREKFYHYDAPLTHKGNCKFCAERRIKELDSLALKIWEGFE